MTCFQMRYCVIGGKKYKFGKTIEFLTILALDKAEIYIIGFPSIFFSLTA